MEGRVRARPPARTKPTWKQRCRAAPLVRPPPHMPMDCGGRTATQSIVIRACGRNERPPYAKGCDEKSRGCLARPMETSRSMSETAVATTIVAMTPRRRAAGMGGPSLSRIWQSCAMLIQPDRMLAEFGPDLPFQPNNIDVGQMFENFGTVSERTWAFLPMLARFWSFATRIRPNMSDVGRSWPKLGFISRRLSC